ncbi:MAG TPA: hypothetical protein VD967_00465 [Candidatus Paceibacterota bacterium]|nr:hypothetical protein [Candidatus Paceibacterota bacterium]
MPKDSFQDVVPPKKTIRDIPIPDHRQRNERERPDIHHQAPPKEVREAREMRGDVSPPSRREVPPPPPPPNPRVYAYGSKGEPLSDSFMGRFWPPKIHFGKIALVVGGLALAGVLLFAGKFLLPKAVVSIVPKVSVISVDEMITANKEAGPEGLQFELMKLSEESSTVVPETGTKTISEKASGTIIVYNDYSSATQRLIKNTRFETPDGKIYRIMVPITVPGKKGNAPGSVEAQVFADQPGEAYNIASADFTIPGFKGDPRYSKFYARTKTAMTGGFSGTVKTASPADVEKARADLSASLTESLKMAANEQKPEGYILYPDAIFTETETLSNPESSEVKQRVTLYGIIFDEKKLSQYLAYRKLAAGDYHGEEITGGETLKNLSFKPQGGGKPWESGSIAFTLSGEATLTWVVDAERLKESLAGIPKKEVPSVLQTYPMDRSSVVVQPFWKSTLPEKPSQIQVVFKEK